jgi:gentisate 1,2-dioxygenase
MELERFKQREAEPKLFDYTWNEARFVRWEEQKKLFEKAPRVRRFDDVPWEQVHMAYHKIFTGAQLPDIPLKLKRAPIYTMSARLQVLQPGGRSGKHRHFAEALFFILEGRGHEIHDDKRYDWEAGDLMCVPSYCTHQHFADPKTGATMFYVASEFCQYLGVGATEQIEFHSDFKMPAGSEPLKDSEGRLIGYRRNDGVEIRLQAYGVSKEAMEKKKMALPQKVETSYDEYMQQFWQESHWRQTCNHVVKTKNLHWENTRLGRIKYIIHPKVDTGIVTYESFLLEIPPKGWSGKSRKVGEEIFFVMDGQGYSILNGVRWDWAKNDVICVPIVTTQQHFNSDLEKPALLLSVRSKLYSFIGHGGVEHLEDASTYPKSK